MKRQKKYILQNFLEIEIFNRPRHKRPYKKARKEKESTPAQKNLNNKRAQKFFNRLIHLNFGPNDLYVDPTFENAFLPPTKEAVLKEIQNYISRIKYHRKRLGIKKKLKYVYVISDVDANGNKVRLHAHLVISGDMDRDLIESLWKKGYCNTERLQFNEYGVTGKSLYMARQAKGDRSWGSSIGLKKPEAVVSDKAITTKIAYHIENYPDDRAYFEKLYPGWAFTDCIIEQHEDKVMGTSYFIRMRKYPSREIKRDVKRKSAA